MRADEFIKAKQEQQVVEVVPAIAAAVGRVGAQMGSAAAKAGMKVATAGMKAGAKAGANLAKGAGKAAMGAIGKAQANISKSILQKGAKLAMPTQGPGGKEQEFDIDDVKGDTVILKNPKPQAGEPQSFVYNKKDLDSLVKAKADAIAQQGKS
jgi:hypothetical protein